MVAVLKALARSMNDIALPPVLAVLMLPMTASLAGWGVLAWFFWDGWQAGLEALLSATAAGQWVAGHLPAWVVSGTGALVIFLMLVPAVLLTAVLLTELVAMPVVLNAVSGRRFPMLERRGTSSPLPGLRNAGVAFSRFIVLWIVTLPLWFTGIGTVVVPLVNAAYLNRRLFSVDALIEHATPEEIAAIRARYGGELYLLGLLLAAMLYVPIVNLIAPVFAALAFVNYGLARLAELRESAGV